MNTSSITRGLTTEQAYAVADRSKFVKIVAGPGSGKTTTLTSKVLYEVALGVKPSRILFSTFTTTAARDINSKLESLSERHGVDTVGVDVGTLHSVANSVCKEHNMDVGRTDKGEPDYDRMITLACECLAEATTSQYDIVFVDEHQDSNEDMWRFIKLLRGNGRLVVVGDPKQAIFMWNGAVEGMLDRISREYRGVKSHMLNVNFRSCRQIVDLCNHMSTRRMTSAAGVGEMPVWDMHNGGSSKREAVWVADIIPRILQLDKDSTVGILCPLNRQLDGVVVEMRSRIYCCQTERHTGVG